MEKNIIAKTFTPIYDKAEDRIRFVINYQDIYNRVDFMITRDLILNLIPSSEEFITKHYGITDFKAKTQTEIETKAKTEIDAKAQNKSVVKTDSVNLQLLRTEEELLMEVNFSFNRNSKHTILTLKSKNIVAKADLDGFMLSQVFQVMKSVIPYIKWGISHHF